MKKVLAGLVLLLSFGVANAALIINVTEQSGDVVFDYSGTVDLASTLGKEADRSITLNDFNGGVTYFRSLNAPTDDYMLNLTASPTFAGSGSGGVVAGDSLLLESAGFSQIWLPDNYASGDMIVGSLTFVSTTFAALGLVNGSHTWSWENGDFSDNGTFNIGPQVMVSTPTSLVLLGLGLIILSFTRKNVNLK